MTTPTPTPLSVPIVDVVPVTNTATGKQQWFVRIRRTGRGPTITGSAAHFGAATRPYAERLAAELRGALADAYFAGRNAREGVTTP